MHMAVDVLARDLRKDEHHLATSCVMVFVALDAPEGKPTPVPSWLPRDNNEQRLQQQAMKLMELSKEMEQLVDTHGAESI
jgi:acyl-CoA hydrolase